MLSAYELHNKCLQPQNYFLTVIEAATLNIVLMQEDPCSPFEQNPSASPEITPIPALAKMNLHPSSPRVLSTTVPSVLIK